MAQYHYTIFFVPLDEGGYKVIVAAIPENLYLRLNHGGSARDGEGCNPMRHRKRPQSWVDMSSPASMWPRSCERAIVHVSTLSLLLPSSSAERRSTPAGAW